MENFQKFFGNLPDRIAQFWNGLNVPKKLAAVSFGVLFVAAIGSLFFIGERVVIICILEIDP